LADCVHIPIQQYVYDNHLFNLK